MVKRFIFLGERPHYMGDTLKRLTRHQTAYAETISSKRVGRSVARFGEMCSKLAGAQNHPVR